MFEIDKMCNFYMGCGTGIAKNVEYWNELWLQLIICLENHTQTHNIRIYNIELYATHAVNTARQALLGQALHLESKLFLPK